jgi:hypothetical protein
MKRTIVWIDSAEQDVHKVREHLKEYFLQMDVEATIFEACEVMESENE